MDKQVISVLLRAMNKHGMSAEHTAAILKDMNRDDAEIPVAVSLVECSEFSERYSTAWHNKYVQAVTAKYFGGN